MEPPQRWSDIVIGLACGLTRQEIAAGLGESPQAISTAVKDIQGTMNQYEDPADFVGELLGAEVDSSLDLDAIEAHREEKENGD